MTKEEIAGVLEQIATLLELKAENPFKIRAYTNAARAIETFGANVSNFQDEEAVAKIPGIGKSIALNQTSYTSLGNISTRSFVQTGEHVMIGGFIVQGSGPKRVIISRHRP